VSHSARLIAALALTLGAANVTLAQVSPRLDWKSLHVPESGSAATPQLAPFRATAQPLPPLLAVGTDKPSAGPAVDKRPSCAMPVASAAAGSGDSMPVARIDITTIEHMPVSPSVCRSTP
jgi:hypothetical protein